jgi:predicted DNA binding CopG/RHH family protein
MSDKKGSKAFPRLGSDEAAEAFVDTADLSAYDFSDMSPTGFEFAAKGARVNMRLPAELLEAVKATASRRGMPYQRFIRLALEDAVTPGKNGRP